MRRDATITKLLAIAEPVCAAAGYEVVDVRLVTEPGGWVLRVYLDRPPALGADGQVVPEDPNLPSPDVVDLNDCERISRELGVVLDVEDPIPQAYSLEVSSPGIDRPLRTPNHFRRFAGAEIKVVLGVPMGERRNFRGRLIKVETLAGRGDVAVVDVDGAEFQLPIDDIETARIVPDWDAVLYPRGTGVKPGHGTKPGQKPGKNKIAKAERAAAKAAAAAKAGTSTEAPEAPESGDDAHDDDAHDDDADDGADDSESSTMTPDPNTGSTTAQ